MKYFIMNNSVRDAEFVYFNQSPRAAISEEQAVLLELQVAKDWMRHQSIQVRVGAEISKREYQIIKKYII